MKHTVSEVTLDNGVRGLLINVPDATVMNYDIEFRAGDYLADTNKWETAHLMEHMVLGANKKYPKGRNFMAEFQKNGAYSNASTSTYEINYIAECADFEWDRILDMLILSLEDPIFPEDEFKAESGNVREELNGLLNNNFRQLVLHGRKAQGMVAMSDESRIELLDNVTLEDVKEHYAKTHTLGNMRFIIAGKIDDSRKKTIIDKLNKLTLPAGTRAALPEEKPIGLKSVNLIHKPGVENIFFLLNIFSHERLEPDEEDALVLLNVMLTATLHSKILGEAREKGLIYHMSSSYNNYLLTTEWWFGGQVSTENASAVTDIIVRELGKVLEGKIDKGDVESAKQYSIGKYQRSVQTVNGLLKGYAGSYYFNERIDDYFAIPDRIKSVTKERLIDVANKMFESQNWGLHILSTNNDKLSSELNNKIGKLWTKVDTKAKK